MSANTAVVIKREEERILGILRPLFSYVQGVRDRDEASRSAAEDDAADGGVLVHGDIPAALNP